MSIETSSIEAALAAVSAATGAVAGLGNLRQLGRRRGEEKVADALKAQSPTEMSTETDPRTVNEYLFKEAGALSLREYVSDPDARAAVERAIARVDELLDQTDESPYGRDESPQLRAATNAFASGEVMGGLAHLRLAIEIALGDLAAQHDLPPTRGATQLLRHLSQAGVMSTPQVQALLRAIHVANGALHGEPVSQDEALTAFAAARDGLHAIGLTGPAVGPESRPPEHERRHGGDRRTQERRQDPEQ
jgi:hypothetical protein